MFAPADCEEWERPAIFIISKSSRAAGEHNQTVSQTFSSGPSHTDVVSFLATCWQTRGSARVFSGQAGTRQPERYRFVHCTLHSVVCFTRLVCVVCYRGAPRRLERQTNGHLQSPDSSAQILTDGAKKWAA